MPVRGHLSTLEEALCVCTHHLPVMPVSLPPGTPTAARLPNTHIQVGMGTQSLQDPISLSSGKEKTNEGLFLVSSKSLISARYLSALVCKEGRPPLGGL